MNIFRQFWEDLKARRRGEVRIAPRGTRGRIYAKRANGGKLEPNAPKEATLRPEATLTMVVTRADGTVETYTKPATVEEKVE